MTNIEDNLCECEGKKLVIDENEKIRGKFVLIISTTDVFLVSISRQKTVKLKSFTFKTKVQKVPSFKKQIQDRAKLCTFYSK